MEREIPATLVAGTLQTAMEDALARQQFYADGEAAYQDTLHTNKAYHSEDVRAYIMARVRGDKPARPQPVPFDPAKPMSQA